MWVDFKKAPNLMVAEMWKEILEAEGLPTRILPEGDILDWGERVPFRIMVPKGREHVAEEILRTLSDDTRELYLDHFLSAPGLLCHHWPLHTSLLQPLRPDRRLDNHLLHRVCPRSLHLDPWVGDIPGGQTYLRALDLVHGRGV